MKKLFLIFLIMLAVNTAFAQQRNALNAQLERFRLALINPSQNILDSMLMDELTYGHSSGKIDNKSVFIADLLSGVSDFEDITIVKQDIITVKNTAVVRQEFVANILDKGQKANIKLHVQTTWVKNKNHWKLLARQAVKLK